MAINFLPLGNAIDLVTSAVTDSITGNAITDAVLTAVLKTEGGVTLATSSALTHTSGGVYKGTFDISGVSLTLNIHYYLVLTASNYAVQWKHLYRAEDRPLQGAGSVSIDLTPGTSGLPTVTGIAIGDGTGAYQTASIVVYHKNGTQTAYPSSADTDAARGTALLAAAAASTQYDKIQLSGGTFNVAANTITVAANVAIQGCGWDQTIITGNKSSAPLILLVSGLHVSDVKVSITVNDASIRFPIGSLSTTSAASVTNVLIERVWINGGSDGFYSVIGVGNDYDFTIRHCVIRTNWDCVALYDKNFSSPANSCTLLIDSCDIRSTGTYTGAVDNRAIVLENIGSVTTIKNSTLIATSTGAGAYGVLIAPNQNNGVVTCNVLGAGYISASGASGENYDLNVTKALSVINIDPTVKLVEGTINAIGTVNRNNSTGTGNIVLATNPTIVDSIFPGGTSSAVEGRLWYDSSAHVLKYHNGSVVKTIATV